MKKLLIGLASILALILLAILVGPLLVPTDSLRARLTTTVHDATGRDLKIAGAIRFRLLPSINITAEGVTFANAPWGSVPEMAKIKSIEIDLRLLPLLGGRFEVAHLILTEPEIDLELGKDGRGNWAFDPPPKPTIATTTASAETRRPAPTIALDDVRLETGRLAFRDHRANSVQTLDHIVVRLVFPGLDQPFSATGAVNWNGEAVSLAFAVTNPGALLAGRDSAIDLKLSAAPLTLAVAGTMLGLPPKRTIGTIDLATPSLRRLAAWTGAPIALPGDALGPLSIKGHITAAGPEMAFSDATITLDAIHATGDLKLTTGGPRPILAGRLNVGALDLNPYLPEPAPPAPAAKTTAGAAPPTASEGWSDAPINLAALKALDANLTLAAEHIAYRKLRIDKPRLALQLQAGNLHADLQEITLYRGQGKSTLAVDTSTAIPNIALSLALAGADINSLLNAAIGMDRLAGTGSLDLAITASGASQRALVASLNGKGALNLADGQIKGVNLLDLARNTASGGGTNFGSLTGTFQIAAGILRNDDLVLKSGLIPTTGAGTVNLPARNIDYRAVPQLAGALKIPINITGPWSRITYRPDGAEALRGIMQPSGKPPEPPKPGTNPGNPLRGLIPRP